MKLFRGSIVVVGLGVSISIACYDSDAVDECWRACATAGACGLLPSPLGADEQPSLEKNCRARCENTDPDRRSQITSCLRNGPLEVSLETAWCGGEDAGTRPILPCDQAAACLVGQFGTAILGKATVDVLLVLPIPADSGAEAAAVDPSRRDCAKPPCAQGSCADAEQLCDPTGCVGAIPSSAAGSWCELSQAREARVFVIQNTTRTADAVDTCAPTLARSASFRELIPGPARAGVQIRGARAVVLDADASPDAGPRTNPFCWVFYGPRIVLGANRGDRAVIPLPAPDDPALVQGTWPYACEDTSEACSDGVDNDGSGFKDCADVQCQPFCPSAPTPCEADAGPQSDAALCAPHDASAQGDGATLDGRPDSD